MRIAFVLFALGLARVAAAHSLTDEVSAGGTQPTQVNPASSFVANRIAGAFDIGSFVLRPTFQYTHTFSVSAPSGANFATSDANIYYLALGLDREIGKHVEIGFEANGSPPASSATDTPIAYTQTVLKQQVQVQADGQLSSNIASAGGTAWFSYDTAGDRKVEGAFELGVAPTEYFLQNQISAVWNKKQELAVPTATVLANCTTAKCPASLVSALQGQTDRLFQARIWASATATIHERTDVTLDGAVYLYDQDPTQVGDFSVAARGRTGGSELGYGNGLPIAPLRYSLKPSVTGRIGRLSLAASFVFGQYVSDASYSYDLGVGVRVQYKINKHVRLWLKASAQRDVDSTNTVAYGGVGALGLRASF